jgi:hypothetical protein
MLRSVIEIYIGLALPIQTSLPPSYLRRSKIHEGFLTDGFTGDS